MIVVLTSKRPEGAPFYLGETLRQIDECAAGKRVVLTDGPLPDGFEPPDGWGVVRSDRPTRKPQNKWVAWSAFDVAAEAGEDLCFFEDDLEFSVGAPAFIERFEVPGDVDVITFFSPWMTKEMPNGLWRINFHAYIMAQAMKFPLRTVRELRRAREEPIWKEGIPLGGFDEILHLIGIRRNWKLGILNPGIVQHVGDVSVVGNGELKGIRVARNYAGRESDARNLEPMKRYGFFS